MDIESLRAKSNMSALCEGPATDSGVTRGWRTKSSCSSGKRWWDIRSSTRPGRGAACWMKCTSGASHDPVSSARRHEQWNGDIAQSTSKTVDAVANRDQVEGLFSVRRGHGRAASSESVSGLTRVHSPLLDLSHHHAVQDASLIPKLAGIPCP